MVSNSKNSLFLIGKKHNFALTCIIIVTTLLQNSGFLKSFLKKLFEIFFTLATSATLSSANGFLSAFTTPVTKTNWNKKICYVVVVRRTFSAIHTEDTCCGRCFGKGKLNKHVGFRHNKAFVRLTVKLIQRTTIGHSGNVFLNCVCVKQLFVVFFFVHDFWSLKISTGRMMVLTEFDCIILHHFLKRCLSILTRVSGCLVLYFLPRSALLWYFLTITYFTVVSVDCMVMCWIINRL